MRKIRFVGCSVVWRAATRAHAWLFMLLVIGGCASTTQVEAVPVESPTRRPQPSDHVAARRADQPTFDEVVKSLRRYQFTSQQAEVRSEVLDEALKADPTIAVPAIYQLWWTGQDVLSYWGKSESRLTRAFVLMLLYCQAGSGADGSTAFPPLDLTRFDTEAQRERSEEIAFVKAHASALAGELMKVFRRVEPDAEVLTKLQRVAHEWDGNPLPVDKDGSPSFTAALFSEQPPRITQPPSLHIREVKLSPAGCTDSQPSVSISLLAPRGAECRVVLVPLHDEEGRTIDLERQPAKGPDATSEIHATKLISLRPTARYEVELICRVLAPGPDGGPTWRPPPTWGHASEAFSTADCSQP